MSEADPHDMRSPDGTMSMVVPRALWDVLEKACHDMRWYCVAQKIPVGRKFISRNAKSPAAR